MICKQVNAYNLCDLMKHVKVSKHPFDVKSWHRCLEPFHRPAEEDTISDSPEEVSDGGFKLTLSLDVSHFKPEELSVNLNEGTLTVEGKQEIKEDDSYSMRSFIRHWELSEDIDINQIHPTLNEDGRLITETAKITKPAVSGRNTPIQKHITEK
ncbi:hypothetical protein Y032_0086g1905 [Ancylostoma ceylanicum]|nr:hypothetical protein Y032_0086g1905 [Ancylostoma ceylanicum]